MIERDIIKQMILVRHLQKAYFKQRQTTDLIASKTEEAKLDRMLLNYEQLMDVAEGKIS